MQAELLSWNGGLGISLGTWVQTKGNFSLAVGYAGIFWPEFVQFEGYILRAGFSEEALRGFEHQTGSNRRGVEWVMNHTHCCDLHLNCSDRTEDKLIVLGNTLREIYQAKLQWQFPERPCTVEFLVAKELSEDHQLSFWQNAPFP